MSLLFDKKSKMEETNGVKTRIEMCIPIKICTLFSPDPKVNNASIQISEDEYLTLHYTHFCLFYAPATYLVMPYAKKEEKI